MMPDKDEGRKKQDLKEILAKLTDEEIEVLREHMTQSSKTRSQFSQQEDDKLKQLVSKYGDDNWIRVSKEMNGRNMRQCRERWKHYLSPSVTNKKWTEEEDCLLRQKYAEFGPKWVMLTQFFTNRTDVNIKNRWVVLLRKDAASQLHQQSQSPRSFFIAQEKTDLSFDVFVSEEDPLGSHVSIA